MTRLPAFLARLRDDRRGAAVIEFAVAIPVFVSFIWGMFQVAMVFEASAGTQHALGEGARYATVYVPANGGPPTDAQIISKITSHKFGTGNGNWGTPTIQTDTTAKTKLITVSYTQPTDFLFFPGPTVVITKTKVANYSFV